MQEISVPPLVQPTTHGNLSDLPHGWAEREPSRVLFSINDGETWRDVSAAEFTDQVRRLARGFVAAGVEIGDRVAIMSCTRYEWTLTDFALWTAGAVPVPVYETSSAEQVSWILNDSGAVAIVVEDPNHMALVTGIREEVPRLRDVWQIEGGALDEVASAGADITEEDLDARRAQVNRSCTATIIYTSGTTGRPKGCLLTHDNFMALAENAIERLDQLLGREGATTLLFLPLAHVFARFIQVAVVAAGARMGHSPDVKTLLDDLASFRPTFLLAVPRVFEKVYNSAEQKAAGDGKAKAAVFARAATVATAWSRAKDDGGPGLALKAQHALFDKLVYAKLRAAMGGQVEYAICGGAALGERLGHFFRGVGVTILEGYGLTETTAPVGVNTPEQVKIGTVGRPLPGVAVRISDEGEILVKGCNVFDSYFNNAEATTAASQDGWFRTGDLGALDNEGFLTVTGRSKELLVTAGGKNVSPAPLEDRLRAHPLVGQCMVVGEGRPFIAALVTLDEEMWPGWAATHGLEGVTLETARAHETVLAAIQEGVDLANTSVSRAESIRSFHVLPVDFTEANGYLTPSLKLRRHVVSKDFAEEIEALYGGPR